MAASRASTSSATACRPHPAPLISDRAVAPRVAEPFTLTIERTLPVDADNAYAWLTDYHPRDADLADAVLVDREILEEGREAGRIVMAETRRSLALERTVRTVVELDAPGAWQATVHGADAGTPDVFTYRLDPIDETRSRLTVTYAYGVGNVVEKGMLWLLSPLVKREIRTMWQGFETAMRREVAPEIQA